MSAWILRREKHLTQVEKNDLDGADLFWSQRGKESREKEKERRNKNKHDGCIRGFAYYIDWSYY